jgi:DNA-binding NarL/FixJ family response regulator
MFRQMVAGRIALLPGLEVVGEATNGAEAITLALSLTPDVVVMDLEMPGMGGHEVLERLKTEAPEIRVLILSGHEEDSDVLGAIDGGASGYVVKSSDVNELCDAIKKVGRGIQYFSAEVASMLVARYQQGSRSPELTERETMIVRLAAEGLTNAEIANLVRLSERTVKQILGQATLKLRAKNRKHLIALAVQRKIVRVDDQRRSRQS